MSMILIKKYEIDGLGDRIRKLREASDKSITVLAAEAGMTASNWYRVEAEKGATPEETVIAMGKALGVDLGVEE